MCGLLFTNNPQVDLNKFRIALNQFYYRGPNYSEVKKSIVLCWVIIGYLFRT